MAKSYLYNVWKNMIRRCVNPKCKQYHRYGGRGINVCDQWRGKSGLEQFCKDMGVRPPGLWLDRINNDGDYEPANCRWATPSEQQRNRSSNVRITAFGKTQTVVEWSEQTGIPFGRIYLRILYEGWTPERALTIPPVLGRNHMWRR